MPAGLISFQERAARVRGRRRLAPNATRGLSRPALARQVIAASAPVGPRPHPHLTLLQHIEEGVHPGAVTHSAAPERAPAAARPDALPEELVRQAVRAAVVAVLHCEQETRAARASSMRVASAYARAGAALTRARTQLFLHARPAESHSARSHWFLKVMQRVLCKAELRLSAAAHPDYLGRLGGIPTLLPPGGA